MARHEGNFEISQAPLSLEELLALLGGQGVDPQSRQEAIACYLSGSDGWRDAVRALGGAFAGEATGLRERKAD